MTNGPQMKQAPPLPVPHSEMSALFERVQEQMAAKLGAAREKVNDSGDHGTTAEDAFREVLREYLPRDLAIGHGEVIDTHGARSAQTDFVIASADHPLTFSSDLPGLFFIEGVLAAGQVKSVLTGEGLEEALAHSR